MVSTFSIGHRYRIISRIWKFIIELFKYLLNLNRFGSDKMKSNIGYSLKKSLRS